MKCLNNQGILERIEKIVLSPHFTFLVGKDRVPVIIHADVVKGLSAPLDVLINNGVMTESTSRQAVLADVELEVFKKFCQFAYTGSYSAHQVVASEEANSKPSTTDYNAKTSFDLKPPSSPVDGTQEASTQDSTAKQKQTTTSYSRKTYTSSEFHRLRSQLETRFSNLRSNDSLTYQPRDIHNIHVRLYIFATRYLIEPLRQLCLDQFHRELSRVKPSPSPEKIVKILIYIYTRITVHEPGKISLMRDLIVRFAASHIRDLSHEKSFRDLADTHPEITVDLFKVMTE